MNRATIGFFVVLVSVPLLPLLLAWWRLLARGDSTIAPNFSTETLPLLVASLSFALFFAGLLFRQVFGPDYSTRRFTTIYLNFAVTSLMVILSLRGKHSRSALIAVAAGMVALVWLYLAVVSSVV
jgi:hypothetical protein